ncbi:MAG: restriction endonuclease subunit S, partial [Gallionella sp.]|nr:restriction endonuclease subunit S [Gallionella sp.]
MEVKPGYKQTEVGVIPEEWEVKALPEVSWFQEGPGLRNWQFTSTGIKVINVTNLEDGVLNLERTDRHISNAEFNRMYRHFAVDAGDIVMASSGNSYSKTAVARVQDLPLVMNTSVIRFKPLKETDYGFLWALLTSPLFKSQIDLMITGGAQPNFGPYHLKRINFPVPNPPEQRAIATALNDVDALLGALERLIAKKRDLKKAAMQQLLTGQTRLPGFSGAWEVNRLGDVGVFSKGRGIKKDDVVADGLPCVRYGEIYTHHNNHLKAFNSFISPEIAKQSQRLQKGDLLFAGSGETTEEIGKCIAFLGDEEAYAGGDIVIFRPGGQDSKFLGFLINHSGVASQKARMGQGDAVVHISARNLARLELHLPSLPEQTAIAEVLSDM